MISTCTSPLLTWMVSQLSVLKAMASKATAARLKMVAKASVTALQKPILMVKQASLAPSHKNPLTHSLSLCTPL